MYMDSRELLNNYIELKKNETLFRENEECKTIGIVINGEIKIVSYSFEGREIIYSINKENTIFGNNLIFSSLPFLLTFAVCLSLSLSIIFAFLLPASRSLFSAHLYLKQLFSKETAAFLLSLSSVIVYHALLSLPFINSLLDSR